MLFFEERGGFGGDHQNGSDVSATGKQVCQQHICIHGYRTSLKLEGTTKG